LALKTYALISQWTTDPANLSVAIDSFLGDIYSGLHAQDLTVREREYADKVLIIFSGLYGCLRPLDGICPYRLEMGYTLPDKRYADLVSFWEKDIANCLPSEGLIVNLSAEEYYRTVIPYVDSTRIVTPHFLTINPSSKEAVFVVVHAKIARGAFARWLITKKIQKKEKLNKFSDLGYSYSETLSTPDKPVFVCTEFGGKGRSIRVTKKSLQNKEK
jgi:cytoplasmic iron level regulating protein YaaA (DUF328/UPF0246 family)